MNKKISLNNYSENLQLTHLVKTHCNLMKRLNKTLKNLNNANVKMQNQSLLKM